MVQKTTVLAIGVLMCTLLPAYSDFKYTESSQITGGALNSMVKFAGVFSKQARQSTQPTETTTYVKGNRMRKDLADGQTQIIDLDARQITYIDNQKRTYSILTFDQMRAAAERARAQMQAQAATRSPGDAPPPNLQVTPKVNVTRTGKTAAILNLPTSEVQMDLDMEMQSTDPKTQGQSANMWVKSDSWVTPSIPGYEELTAFSQRFGKEMSWLPGEMFGGNVQTSQGMAELRQHASELKGFPVLQYVSMGMAPTGQSGQTQQPPPAQAQPSESQSVSLTNPRDAITKGLGGMFSHRRKQNQDQDQPAAASTSGQPAPPPSTPGSLMDMTVQVKSYSSDSLDAGLFAPPTGYVQIPYAEPEAGRAASQ